jgi:hypothetical protein
MGKTTTILFAIIVVVLGIWAITSFHVELNPNPSPTVSASRITLSSSPSASTSGGPTRTMTPGKTDLITVSKPAVKAIVHSPLTVTGQARGTWYFEASFPVKIYNANGVLLGSTIAQAQGDWMTTNFVPFTATLSFSTPNTSTGYIVLEKDNPSGLPQNDDQLVVPVRFQ